MATPHVSDTVDANDESDAALIARIRAGDKSACGVCIRNHSPHIYRLALRLVHNETEAEDVMQQTFLNAFQAIDSFDGRSSLLTWLYRIAYNTAMMRLRKPGRDTVSVDDPALSDDDGGIVPEQLFDWCCLPEQDFDTNEAREQLESAIDRLPDKLKAVFLMRELQGLSTEETANALDVSADVVKQRLRRARLWLRDQLSSYFNEMTQQEA